MMLRVGEAFNAELQRLIVNEVEKDIEAMLLPLIYEEAPNYTADAWPQRIATIIDLLLERWASRPVRALAERLASNFVRSTLSFAERTQKRTLGIEVFQNSQQLTDYLSAATIQNVKLIESIPQRYIENVSNTVLTGMRTGVRPEVIAKQLRDDYGVTQRRAKFIARDQAAKINGEIQKQRQIDAGYEYFKWIDSHDARVRHGHKEIANADVGYGVGIYAWNDLPTSSSGETIQPGSDYNCFPGHSPVNIFAGVKKVFRHPFRGVLTRLVAVDGSVFESTPNHPVLTDRGFVAANLINVGDKIVKVPQQAFHAHKGNSESSNIKFSEFFEACKLLGVTYESAPSFGSEFHGDIADNQKIDVISFDWSLPDGFDPTAAQSLVEFLFTFSDQVVVPNNASGIGDVAPVLNGITLAPDSIVRRLCQLLTLGGGSLAHPDKHSLASVRLLYSVFIQNSSDDVARGVEFFGDCFDANISIEKRLDLFKRYVLLIGRYAFGLGQNETPGADFFTNVVGVSAELGSSGFEVIPLQYELITIVDKSVSEFDGHVYNLEMEQGLFVAQDTAVSNCRCIARPVRNSVVERHLANKKD